MTDFSQDPSPDILLDRQLHNHFDEVLYWAQGPGDRQYIAGILKQPPRFLGPGLEAFDAALDQPRTSYVGLRLHGGIHAIQKGIPTLILSIDNRTREISSSTGLRTLSRYHVGRLAEHMDGTVQSLNIPRAEIAEWKKPWGL